MTTKTPKTVLVTGMGDLALFADWTCDELVACLGGSPVYHLTTRPKDPNEGRWNALCGAGEGAAGRDRVGALARHHRFRICRACVRYFAAGCPCSTCEPRGDVHEAPVHLVTP